MGSVGIQVATEKNPEFRCKSRVLMGHLTEPISMCWD